MPSPIPSPIYAGVNKPNGATQVGCVNCLDEGVYAPQEIIYQYGGYSMCMKHTQSALLRARNPVNVS